MIQNANPDLIPESIRVLQATKKTNIDKNIKYLLAHADEPRVCNRRTFNTPLLVKWHQYNRLSRIYINHAPKFERYGGLATDIIRQGDLVLSLIIRCNKKFYKKTDITDLDIAHEVLRELWRTFYELGYFKFKHGSENHDVTQDEELQRFASINRLIDDMGAMIGSWHNKITKDLENTNQKA